MFVRARKRQIGLTLIELMIGLVLGLLVTGIAIQMYISTLGITKQTTETIRLNQELRAISDLIVTDLRRAGYWSNAVTGGANPYSSLVSGSYGATHVQIFDSPAGGTNNCIVLSYENANASPTEHIYGYRVNNSAIEMLTVTSFASGSVADCGEPSSYSAVGSWDALSDKRLMSVALDTLAFTLNPASAASWAASSSKSIEVSVKGTSVADTRLSREIKETVRIRNEY